MTRFLAEALQTQEPYFKEAIAALEAANGNPSVDIRFTNQILLRTKAKLSQLGLDPKDTTPEELYEALKLRLSQDDQLLTRRLRTLSATHVSAEAETAAGMVQALKRLPDSKHCYALKTSRLKSLIKAQPPKKAMKKLGYRSLESMLKLEPAALILASAWICESMSWRKSYTDQYKKLSPADFEERPITIISPSSRRWGDLSREVVDTYKHNLICFRELGTLILLPLPADLPSGVVTASLCLSLHELNEIRVCSSFLKLKQVKSDFGASVGHITADEPLLSSELIDQPVPWHLVQRYYSRASHHFREDIFEPYVQLEDMVWHPIEKALGRIEPKLSFWQGTATLGLVDQAKPVSMNIVDSALNLCNFRQFEERVGHYFQRSVWHELMLSYLKKDPLEKTVLAEFQPQFAEERVLA